MGTTSAAVYGNRKILSHSDRLSFHNGKEDLPSKHMRNVVSRIENEEIRCKKCIPVMFDKSVSEPGLIIVKV